jgi:hypothetical protein
MISPKQNDSRKLDNGKNGQYFSNVNKEKGHLNVAANPIEAMRVAVAPSQTRKSDSIFDLWFYEIQYPAKFGVMLGASPRLRGRSGMKGFRQSESRALRALGAGALRRHSRGLLL